MGAGLRSTPPRSSCSPRSEREAEQVEHDGPDCDAPENYETQGDVDVPALPRGRLHVEHPFTFGGRPESPVARLSVEKTKALSLQGFRQAAGLGLEPRLPDPESGVLPLDDPAAPRHCSPIPTASFSFVTGDVDVELVHIGALPRRVWLDLTERDTAAFGATTAGLIYRDKDQHLALRLPNGRFAAAIGLTVVTVEVVGHEPFEVVGVGSLIVRREHRGSGLGRRLSAAAREVMVDIGPDRAMLFCEPGAIALNRRRGYTHLEVPVLVDQPGERIVMPIPAMWRPIRPCAWPAGPVDVHGLPF